MAALPTVLILCSIVNKVDAAGVSNTTFASSLNTTLILSAFSYGRTLFITLLMPQVQLFDKAGAPFWGFVYFMGYVWSMGYLALCIVYWHYLQRLDLYSKQDPTSLYVNLILSGFLLATLGTLNWITIFHNVAALERSEVTKPFALSFRLSATMWYMHVPLLYSFIAHTYVAFSDWNTTLADQLNLFPFDIQLAFRITVCANWAEYACSIIKACFMRREKASLLVVQMAQQVPVQLA